MTVIKFTLEYQVQIPSRRLDDFRVITLEDHELLTHNMFGESRTGITDGVHAWCVFPDGVREVMLANLRVKGVSRDPSAATERPVGKPRLKSAMTLLLESL